MTGMLRMKGIGRVVAWVVCFAAGGVRGQEYVLEPLPLAPLQAKWAVGWDAGRLLRGQAVATLERSPPSYNSPAAAAARDTRRRRDTPTRATPRAAARTTPRSRRRLAAAR